VEEKLPAKAVKEPHAIEDMERAAMAFQKIMTIAIKNTHPTDWVNFGGQAWLDTPGAERVARAIGLVVRDWKWEKHDFKDDEGQYFVIICTGQVGHPVYDVWSDAIGTQWSRKPFYWKEGDRKKHIGEIHPGNIIKDAYSDMVRNGVTRFLGLRGLPWSYLKEFGITVEKATQVEFEKGKRGGKAKPAKKPPAQDEYASDEQISVLARTAANKVIMTDEAKIKETLPPKMTRTALNTLLKYVATLPTEIELEAWVEKVKEVT